MWIAPITLGMCSSLLQIQDHNFCNKGIGMWTAGQISSTEFKVLWRKGENQELQYRDGETLLMIMGRGQGSLGPIIRLLGLTRIYWQVTCWFHQGMLNLNCRDGGEKYPAKCIFKKLYMVEDYEKNTKIIIDILWYFKEKIQEQ